MRFLFLGDIVGRSGRQAVVREVPRLRDKLKLDAVIVNCENAAGGFGITEKIATELFGAGVDVLTSGNHVFDQRVVMDYMKNEPRLLRPANFADDAPGYGAGLFAVKGGLKLAVINVQGRVFMEYVDDPFKVTDGIIANYKMVDRADAVLVDFHGEATAEKMAFGHYLDGRASLVVGTHTHVPTADLQILPGGTAYQSDAGMCGDYVSVIGMDKEEPVRRMVERTPGTRYTPALGEATVCGVMVETDPATGKAINTGPVRVGGSLAETLPDF